MLSSGVELHIFSQYDGEEKIPCLCCELCIRISVLTSSLVTEELQLMKLHAKSKHLKFMTVSEICKNYIHVLSNFISLS